MRQNSDYEIDEDVSELDAIDAVDIASEFLLQVDAYLRENGFTS